ncbi:MAG: dephospho-CoA kinase [Sphingomonadaceae bacterium]|jgi:dephospho-CoA kinase|uniref:dephospho-CoA kinase n=1 Tax=Sphingorhabdus sp. TaxID=1902408 RepID=UPI002FDA61D7|nr:dephospho-CoA kinase [Sphingomonadaceae bacterium]
MKKPMIIGLTGSIGMGKSAVAAMFFDEGVPVFDADAVVHDLQKSGGALVPAIELAFPGTTGPEGVDRKALGAAVFGDRDRLALLESIIHPAVGERRKTFLESHQGTDMILFDIPLLFEKGGQAGVDTVVVVSAPAPAQRERVLARPNMTPDKFEHILALQMNDADKRARADHVIDTGKDIKETRADVRALVKKLRAGLA